jgi:hypothetical protein
MFDLSTLVAKFWDIISCLCILIIIWKEAVVAFFEVLSRRLPGETEVSHEEAQSGQPISRPRFEPELPNTKQEC